MRTYSRVYDSYAAAQSVVAELEQVGFTSSEISLLANRQATGHDGLTGDGSDESTGTGTGVAVGATVGAGAGLLAGLGMLAIPGLGPVVAAGWLASTLAGAVAGSAAGGIVGALTDAGVSDEDAPVYSEAVRRGGTLLTVRTDRPESELMAILDRAGPVDIAARRQEYTSAGWSGYDPNAPDYTPTSEELQRMRRAV